MTITLHDMDILDAQLAAHDGLMTKSEYETFLAMEDMWANESFAFEQFIEDSLARYRRVYDEYGI